MSHYIWALPPVVILFSKDMVANYFYDRQCFNPSVRTYLRVIEEQRPSGRIFTLYSLFGSIESCPVRFQVNTPITDRGKLIYPPGLLKHNIPDIFRKLPALQPVYDNSTDRNLPLQGFTSGFSMD